MRDAFIFRSANRQGRSYMLFLTAIVRLAPSVQPPSDDLVGQSRLGHAGLTVIALIYVLVTFWQQ
jgi:hypothetical protein